MTVNVDVSVLDWIAKIMFVECGRILLFGYYVFGLHLCLLSVECGLCGRMPEY